MISIICLFKLVYLNDLLFDEWVDHVVKELNVEEALKSSILVVQNAAPVPPSWSFLNGLLFNEWVDHVVKELNVKEALISSFFVV